MEKQCSCFSSLGEISITPENYFTEYLKIEKLLPENLKKFHNDFMITHTESGKNWEEYEKSSVIKRIINKYFDKLDEYLAKEQIKVPEITKIEPEPEEVEIKVEPEVVPEIKPEVVPEIESKVEPDIESVILEAINKYNANKENLKGYVIAVVKTSSYSYNFFFPLRGEYNEGDKQKETDFEIIKIIDIEEPEIVVKPKVKKEKPVKIPPVIKPKVVKKIDEAVKYIKIILDWNEKTIPRKELFSFLMSLQKALEDETINKTSKYFKEIRLLETSMVELYNSTRKPSIKIELNKSVLTRWTEISKKIGADRKCEGCELGGTKRCPIGTEVQSLLFDKNYFTKQKAKSWAKKNGYKYGDVDEGGEKARYIHLRQEESDDYFKGSLRRISFGKGDKGIRAVIGCPKKTVGIVDYSKAPRFQPTVIDDNAEDLQKSIKYSLTLYCDAKASAGRYGICDKDGNVVWHGRFFEEDDAGEQSRAELSAAKKAVWFASKVKESLEQNALMLNLFVDAEWLTYQDHGGQKGYVLTQIARKYNIKLNVSWIPGVENPADEWTTASGFKKWSDNDLTKLAEPIIEGKDLGYYKWRPSASQRREFAERMQDPEEKAAYEERKRLKHSYEGFKEKDFVPTKEQHDFCMQHSDLFVTSEQMEALNMVTSAYASNEKCNHTYIHIVNELRRSTGLGDTNTDVKDTNKMITAKELLKKNWRLYNFSDEWKKVFGEATKPFSVLIFGKPKSYKSTFAILFADYFSKHFGNVLYVAAEEYDSPTIQARLRRLGIDAEKIYISEKIEDMPGGIIPDLIIVDTINKAQLKAEQIRELKIKYPNTSFIFIAQTTKEGEFRGEQDIAHEQDIVVEMKDGEAFANGRFIQGGYLNIKNLA